MDKVIPILPCPDVRAQAAFYQQMGFELTGLYVSPNPYATLRFGSIELHFYGTKKIQPGANSTMCYLTVGDVDAVYDVFAGGLKKHTGKVPRSGLPRITKVRDLSHDRRFTLTDPGGNTLYVGTPLTSAAALFFRSLDQEEFAKRFAALYDVVYSKEDCELAAGMLPKYQADRAALNPLNLAKFMLLELEIQLQLEQPLKDEALQELLKNYKGSDWERIGKRYDSLLQERNGG